MLKYKSTMKKSEGFKWLKENAHKFGFSPYRYEPWHWELLAPLENFLSGKEFTSDYAVRVTEKVMQHDLIGKNIQGELSSSETFKWNKYKRIVFRYPDGKNALGEKPVAKITSAPVDVAGLTPDEQRSQAAAWNTKTGF